MKRLTLLFVSLIFTVNMIAQENFKAEKSANLPYYEVPEYTGEYTAGKVAARMVDGLGFRYRWATENLRTEDLNYKPSEKGRSTGETVDHILNLSRVIVNSTLKTVTDFTKKQPELTFEQKRKETLENFKKASDILIQATKVEDFKIKFVFTEEESEYPFWNHINGPIADAIWHSGQVASFRRSSGNPINPNVQFLQGKIKK